MSEPRIETLSGGLVLSRDASLLQEGELQVAEDVMLKPASSALYKVRGRVLFDDSLPTEIDALGYAPFESDPHQLVIIDEGTYNITPAELAGDLEEVDDGAGQSLKVVPMLDRCVLLTGAVTEGNRVLLSDGTIRPHGLRPVSATPHADETSSGGAWPLGADDIGFFEYWTTEVYKVGEGAEEGEEEVEGTFTGVPATVEVTSGSSYVTISAPDVVNDQATHWRVYRSDSRESASDPPKFPLGWRIATIPISQRTFTDGLPSTAGPSPATSTTTPATLLVPLADSTVDVLLGGFVDPDKVLLDDNQTTTSITVKRDTTSFPGIVLKTIAQIQLNNFGFSNITMPITSITLSIEGSKSAVVDVIAHLSWDGGTSWTAGKTVGLGTGNGTVTVGGDAWGRTWSTDELTDANFKVLLVASSGNPTGGNALLDYVTATVIYNSAPAVLVDTFPNVLLTIGGKSSPIGANGYPPGSAAGAVFQGSLLLIDAENPEELVWSIPGTLDYFPLHYRMVIGDPMFTIDTLGSICILGGRGSMIRLNYVPNADDPEFNTGRAFDVFDTDGGVSGLHGTVRFTMNGQPTLFYVGTNDLKLTNGFTTTNACDDLIWTDLINVGRLREVHVEHNALDHEILVSYPPKDALDDNFKVLRLQYHPTHLRNGKLKIAGITNYSCHHMTSGIAPSGERRIYTSMNNEIFLENRGFTDESGQGIVPRVESREVHLAGIGNSWEAPLLGIHHAGQGGDVAVVLRSAMANNPIYESGEITIPTDTRRLSLVDKAHSGDGLSVELTGQDDGLPLQIDYLVFFANDLGPTTPLKT